MIDEEYKRIEIKCTFRRTFRDYIDLVLEMVMFDTYSNDFWVIRYVVFGKFV